ncbi:hypothetical protein Q9189_000673 [Teloschistes chrysophthalmus]
MTPLRSSRLVNSIACASHPLSHVRVHNLPALRQFSSTIPHRSGDAHSHYDPPSGWLWGIPPGEKREKEGWETVWIYGFFGGLLMAAVAYAYKPDTSIQTWALEEARRRLEAEGILPDPSPKD